MRNNNDLPLTLLGDLDRVTQVTNTVVDLDFVVQELLERTHIEDLVGGGLRCIDDELPYPQSVSQLPIIK